MSEIETKEDASADLDLDERRLCPDGGCIGVLGADGACKVCGRRDDGSVAPVAARSTVDEDDDSDEDEGEIEPGSGAVTVGDADDIAARELCPDGSCVGVVGADGKCKVCGLSATEKQA